MDQLGHVNNVTYVDYLQEARVDMFREHAPERGGEELAEGVVVVRHEVQYVAPLVFRREPVSVEVWATEIRAASFTLACEVFDETDDGRQVYLRARSLLTPYVFDTQRPRRLTEQERAVLNGFLEPADDPLRPTVEVGEASPDQTHTYDCAVRFSDIDPFGHVNNVKYFEYFQEARIAHVAGLGRLLSGEGPEDEATGVVVAQVDVDYRSPMLLREEPYAVKTWVAGVGSSSFVIEGEISDGESVVSRSRVVMVAFDAAKQRSARLSERQRELLRTGGRLENAPAR
jgi:acyl-CoA thioester hydrolase